jgi:hypothetical protein
MPWLGPWPDAPDTHKMWADSGSVLEAAIRASGFDVVQAAPGSDEPPAVLLTDLLAQEQNEEEVTPCPRTTTTCPSDT